MPNAEKDLALEKLKGDPNMWMRLTMLSEDGKTMESVFTDKENPFIKNSAGAMDKIRRLANEGRLYLREEGRSRHFHAVNRDGDSLKLGEQREMKMANTASGPGLAVLMWLSKHYFRWIGLDAISKWLGFNGISNWFEKKLQDRRDAIEVDDRYSKEYRAMSDQKKKELNALRKHEKLMKKLEKIQKEAQLSEQTLNELRGQQAPTTTQQAPTTTQQAPTAPQQQAPLTQPPEIKPNENTMQPTRLGDQPVQQNPPVSPKTNQFAVQQTTQQEIPGTKKEEKTQGENTKDNKIVINGVELTDETVNQFPPHVVDAFRVIQQMISEQEAALKANQQEQAPAQPEANREEQPALMDVEQPAHLQVEDDPEMNQNPPVMNTNQVEAVFHPTVIPYVEEREMTQEELERMFEGTDAPTMDDALPDREADAPLVHGADLEPDQVNVQQRHENQPQTPLQERLAAEKEAMDSVVNWESRLANTLFSSEGVSTAKEYYDTIKDNDGPNFLAGTVCGLLSTTGDPETRKQIMEGLVSGKPLGSEYDDRINEGVTAYNHAFEQMSKGNRDPMTKLITDAALELGRQASQETSLSTRHVMIGRMISNAMTLADNQNLSLKYSDEQWATIRGAFELSKLAQKHYDAKQLLGKENVDMTSKEGRSAVRDLLMGNAVENMIRFDQKHGQQITDTQVLMGCGYLNVENLMNMMSATTIRGSITPEQVKNVLEKPNAYKTARIAKQIGDELCNIMQERFENSNQNMQIERQNEIAPEKQQPESAQVQQPM